MTIVGGEWERINKMSSADPRILEEKDLRRDTIHSRRGKGGGGESG